MEDTSESINKDYKRSPSKITYKADPPFRSETFLSALRAYEQHRKQKRAPLTEVARSSLLRKLAGWGEERATRALIYSTEQGYTGCFEEKVNGTNNTRNIADSASDFQFKPNAVIR